MFFRLTLALCGSPRTMKNNQTATSTTACRYLWKHSKACIWHKIKLSEVCWEGGVSRLRAFLLQQLQVKATKHQTVSHQAPPHCSLPPHKTLQASLKCGNDGFPYLCVLLTNGYIASWVPLLVRGLIKKMMHWMVLSVAYVFPPSRWTTYARTKLDTFIEFPLNGLDMSNYLLNNLSGTRSIY